MRAGMVEVNHDAARAPAIVDRGSVDPRDAGSDWTAWTRRGGIGEHPARSQVVELVLGGLQRASRLGDDVVVVELFCAHRRRVRRLGEEAPMIGADVVNDMPRSGCRRTRAERAPFNATKGATCPPHSRLLAAYTMVF